MEAGYIKRFNGKKHLLCYTTTYLKNQFKHETKRNVLAVYNTFVGWFVVIRVI
jgi:hypothetical protein